MQCFFQSIDDVQYGGFAGGTFAKNPPSMQETAEDTGLIPGLQDSLEQEGQLTPVFLPEKSHGQEEEPGRLQSMGSQRVGHDQATEHKDEET